MARTKTSTGGTRPLTADEIARKAGISVAEVNSLSWLASWDSVPFGKMQRFIEACGIDLTDRTELRRHSSYIRNNAPFRYLRKSPDWNSVYKPMIVAYVTARSASNQT